MNSLERLMFALNDHVTIVPGVKKDIREPKLDATFLGTLQLKSHRMLLEAAIDQPNKSMATIQALAALGNAFESSRAPRVLDAIKLLSELRVALMEHQKFPSDNVKRALDLWAREADDDVPPKKKG